MKEDEFLSLIKDTASENFLDMLCENFGFTKESLRDADDNTMDFLDRFGVTKEDLKVYLGEKKEKETTIYDCSCLPEDFTEEDFNYMLNRDKDEHEENALGFV